METFPDFKARRRLHMQKFGQGELPRSCFTRCKSTGPLTDYVTNFSLGIRSTTWLENQKILDIDGNDICRENVEFDHNRITF